MLAADLQGKFKGVFTCKHCGAEDDWSASATQTSEDVLTSYCIGSLRYLRPSLGVIPFLKSIAPDWNTDGAWDLELWQGTTVPIIKVGEGEVRLVHCEPDAVLSVEGASVVVEAKFRAHLGEDPTQLAEEAIVAHRLAGGNRWLLLCVTDGRKEPFVPMFAAREGRIVQDNATRRPLAEATASYFSAARQVIRILPVAWPSAEDVGSRVMWISWDRLGKVLQKAAGSEDAEPHEKALVEDLVEALSQRGLLLADFGGFNALKAIAPVRWPDKAVLPSYRRQTKFSGFRSMATFDAPWSKVRLLAQRTVGSGGSFRGFSRIAAMAGGLTAIGLVSHLWSRPAKKRGGGR